MASLQGTSAPGRRAGAPTETADIRLMRAALLFAVAVLVHNSDHLRRGVDTLSPDVFWVGTAGILLEVGLVILICQRHRLAPIASAIGGLTLAGGYIEVHFLPAHAWLSDSFTSASSFSALSWMAASLEIAAALTLATVGLTALRSRGEVESATRPHGAQGSLREGLLHPLALGFVLSQLMLLIVAFVQR